MFRVICLVGDTTKQTNPHNQTIGKMAMQADLHDISIDSIIKLNLELDASLRFLTERFELVSGDEKALIRSQFAVVFVALESALASSERCVEHLSVLEKLAA